MNFWPRNATYSFFGDEELFGMSSYTRQNFQNIIPVSLLFIFIIDSIRRGRSSIASLRHCCFATQKMKSRIDPKIKMIKEQAKGD